MNILVLSLLFTLIISTLSDIINPAPLKIAFNSDQIDDLKMNVFRPLVEQKAQNIKVPNIPINLTSPFTMNGILDNVTLVSLSLDWNNTHFLSLDPDNNNYVDLKIAGLSTVVNFSATLGIIKQEGNSMNITNMDILVKLGFESSDVGTVNLFVEDAIVSIQSIVPNFESDFLDIITRALGHELEPIISKVLVKAIKASNDTIRNITAKTLSVAVPNTSLIVNVSLADIPTNQTINNNVYQQIALNFAIEDNITHQVAPVGFTDTLPDLISTELPFQLFVSDVMISQILWAVFNSGLLNVTLSEKNAPPQIPVSLNTTDLAILFPNIVTDFPPSKGVYFNVQKGGSYPLAEITDGRLVLDLSLMLNVYIDVDSSNYPNQGLENCTTCQLGYQLNLSAFVAVDIYGINATAVGVRVMDVYLNQVDKVFGNMDAGSFQNSLNELLTPLLAQINEGLSGGLVVPDIGLLAIYGLDNISVMFGPNFLFFGLELVPVPDPSIEPLESIIVK